MERHRKCIILWETSEWLYNVEIKRSKVKVTGNKNVKTDFHASTWNLEWFTSN